MNKSINAQVEALAKSKNPTAIKNWWNTLSITQKSLAIAAIAALGAGTIYYFVLAGAVTTTSQAIYGAVYAGTMYGAGTYLIANTIISIDSMDKNYEEAEYYDITA